LENVPKRPHNAPAEDKSNNKTKDFKQQQQQQQTLNTNNKTKQQHKQSKQPQIKQHSKTQQKQTYNKQEQTNKNAVAVASWGWGSWGCPGWALGRSGLSLGVLVPLMFCWRLLSPLAVGGSVLGASGVGNAQGGCLMCECPRPGVLRMRYRLHILRHRSSHAKA
jgi:hypothetical protein